MIKINASTNKTLSLPEVVQYNALHQSEKTLKLGDRRFACVAALYFQGKRLSYITVIDETRASAIRAASDFINCGKRALDDSSYAERMRNVAYRSESRLRAMGG